MNLEHWTIVLNHISIEKISVWNYKKIQTLTENRIIWLLYGLYFL